jgi:putative NADH-flavin reductase
MAGSRRFNLSTIGRNDVMALTEEAAKISGIDYVMDAYRDVAEQILDD